MALLLATALLAGCGEQPEAAPATRAATRPTAAASTSNTTPVPTGTTHTGAPPRATFTLDTHRPTPLAERAPAQAHAFMQAYARPAGVGPGSFGWWASVAPYLSARARKELKRDNPMSVPFTRVTGPGHDAVMGTTHGQACARVTVPTNRGPWTVTVVTNRFNQMLIDDAQPAH